ncbi:hypothetical protein BZL30_9348 [Mycobacterium kansasii]|uniref:Uncharacterized protein n=1 Tax=Mycobacterium kansasii TaxID=1768 RepID=A0A1V3WAM9_MYCKA|nr:hypothetical protein BZL30_9348 [Mycobacterium kansasii]
MLDIRATTADDVRSPTSTPANATTMPSTPSKRDLPRHVQHGHSV